METIPNIGPREIRNRQAFGIGVLMVTMGFFALLIGIGVDPLWRLLLFIPLWVSLLGLMQAKDKT